MAALLFVPQDADRLLRDLADDEVTVRDAAQAEVLKLGREKAAPILARAAAHKVPEVRARARAIRNIFNPPPAPSPQRWWLVRSFVLASGGVIVEGLVVDGVELDLYAALSPSFDIEAPAAPSAPTGPPPKAEEVRLWIGDLAADALKAREAASANLRAAGKHVEKELKEAAASRDREVAFRARSILKLIERRPVVQQHKVIHLTGFKEVEVLKGVDAGKWTIIESADKTTTIEITPAKADAKPKE